MKIFILGGTGMLGSNLVKLYKKLGHEVKAFSRTHATNIPQENNYCINFTTLTGSLVKYFQEWQPDIIINTIAIVDLSFCEKHPNEAWQINVNIAKITALVAKQYKSYFVHISTDHFYQDDKLKHKESDHQVILNQYAETKRRAEIEVLKVYKNSLIVRTNIIGFRHTKQPAFFEWLLRNLQAQQPITLFDDYLTSPISAKNIGKILLSCYTHRSYGIYNISASNVVSKYTFGLQVASQFRLSTNAVSKGSLQTFNNKSNITRSFNNGLDTTKIEKELSQSMPNVQDSIFQLYQDYQEEMTDK